MNAEHAADVAAGEARRLRARDDLRLGNKSAQAARSANRADSISCRSAAGSPRTDLARGHQLFDRRQACPWSRQARLRRASHLPGSAKNAASAGLRARAIGTRLRQSPSSP